MGSYLVEIRRCHHIKTSGAQCGSPALRNEKLCYYHKHNRLAAAQLYMDGDRYCDSQIMIPPFEDAHSIQMVLRHVVQLMLQKRINPKDAGLMLYALQIASGNLKQLQAEKPRPTQVVMDPDKVGETPIGMTPWSASGHGHDPDEEEDYDREGEAAARQEQGNEAERPPAPPPSAEELYDAMTPTEKRETRDKIEKEGLIDPIAFDNYFKFDEPDPVLLLLTQQCAERDRQLQAEIANSQTAGA
jgi:hypothetical protein